MKTCKCGAVRQHRVTTQKHERTIARYRRVNDVLVMPLEVEYVSATFDVRGLGTWSCPRRCSA
jgi:hypothetical protein